MSFSLFVYNNILKHSWALSLALSLLFLKLISVRVRILVTRQWNSTHREIIPRYLPSSEVRLN